MSKLKKELLNQMIENALTFKQEEKKLKSNFLDRKFNGSIFKQIVYGLTFASLIISCFFIPQITISRTVVDVNEINDFLTYGIIEDL